MPRRRVVAKREVLPDPKYGNVTLAKFMNHVMVSGKKSVAERIVYGALDIVQERLSKNPIEAFDEALENIAPMVEVKPRRVGGATYQVPVEVRPSPGHHGPSSVRWLVGLRPRSPREAPWRERLANEILDASNGIGATRSSDARTSTSMAESNKAFAHYRW